MFALDITQQEIIRHKHDMTQSCVIFMEHEHDQSKHDTAQHLIQDCNF